MKAGGCSIGLRVFANLRAPFSDLISWTNAFCVIEAHSLLISVALVSTQELRSRLLRLKLKTKDTRNTYLVTS